MSGKNRIAKFFSDAPLDDTHQKDAEAMAVLKDAVGTLIARCRAEGVDDDRLSGVIAKAIGRALAIVLGYEWRG